MWAGTFNMWRRVWEGHVKHGREGLLRCKKSNYKCEIYTFITKTNNTNSLDTYNNHIHSCEMIDNHSIMHKLILTPHLYEKPGDQNRHPGVPAARCAFGGRQNYSWERERWRTLLIWSVTEYIDSYFHMKQELSADQQLKVNKATTAGESITRTSRSLSENIHSSSHETHANRRHSTCWTDEDTHTHTQPRKLFTD